MALGNSRNFIKMGMLGVVARDGIEPPTPAFSGLLTDNAKRFGICSPTSKGLLQESLASLQHLGRNFSSSYPRNMIKAGGANERPSRSWS